MVDRAKMENGDGQVCCQHENDNGDGHVWSTVPRWRMEMVRYVVTMRIAMRKVMLIMVVMVWGSTFRVL